MNDLNLNAIVLQKTRCDGRYPCERCHKHKKECTYEREVGSLRKTASRPELHGNSKISPAVLLHQTLTSDSGLPLTYKSSVAPTNQAFAFNDAISMDGYSLNGLTYEMAAGQRAPKGQAAMRVEQVVAPQIRMDLITKFFKFIHPKFPVLFEQTFMAKITEHSHFLMYSIYACACTVQFTSTNNPLSACNLSADCRDAEGYFNAAKVIYGDALSVTSVANAYALALLSYYCAATGKEGSSLWMSQAIQMGRYMGLCVETPEQASLPPCDANAEVQRRLWWVLSEMYTTVHYSCRFVGDYATEKDFLIGFPMMDAY